MRLTGANIPAAVKFYWSEIVENLTELATTVLVLIYAESDETTKYQFFGYDGQSDHAI